MNEMVARTMVSTFQAVDHVSLWKFVKVVQMGVSTSKRPEGVKNFSLGGENG